MKKTIALLMAICMLNFTIQAGTNNPIKGNEISDMFQDLNQLEKYVNENEGVTLSSIADSDNYRLLNDANIDVSKSSAHEYPVNKNDYSWKKNKTKYIIGGIIVVLVVTLYVLTGGEGYSSR